MNFHPSTICTTLCRVDKIGIKNPIIRPHSQIFPLRVYDMPVLSTVADRVEKIVSMWGTHCKQITDRNYFDSWIDGRGTLVNGVAYAGFLHIGGPWPSPRGGGGAERVGPWGGGAISTSIYDFVCPIGSLTHIWPQLRLKEPPPYFGHVERIEKRISEMKDNRG